MQEGTAAKEKANGHEKPEKLQEEAIAVRYEGGQG